MKLINAYYEILPEIKTIQDMKRNIELGGRVCYKSEDKITEDSADKFIQTLIKSGHTSVLEHGTIYLLIPTKLFNELNIVRYHENKYTVIDIAWNYFGEEKHGYAITTNYRVLVENGWTDDLQYWCEPTEYHEKRYSVRFVCDRGVSHEFVRHRAFSFSQESTRYCNYSKDKFGNEITCIIPSWLDIPEGTTWYKDGFRYKVGANLETFNLGYFEKDEKARKYNYYLQALVNAEKSYFNLINNDEWTAQQARAVLPNSLKTELIMTGFASDWGKTLLKIWIGNETAEQIIHTKGFFGLRDANSAHPQARELAEPLHKEFIKRGYV